MRKYLLILFLSQQFSFSQSNQFDFHSPQNIKLFADHLFCEADYLRAIEQYELLPVQFKNDTTDFKIMIGYSNLELYTESNKIFKSITADSKYYSDGYLLSIKNHLLIKPDVLRQNPISTFSESQLLSFQKIKTISQLYSDQPMVDEIEFVNAFDKDDERELSFLYKYKFDPPYKNPALAGIMSGIIPGSGKMYVGEWGDGVVGLLITGLFAYLAFDNFQADHTTRAWIFTGLGAFFYAGNIYGSIASAQIFNAKIDFEFQNGLKLYLENENYFLSEYDFCK